MRGGGARTCTPRLADRLTGILLVGGASTRFGSPKALALYDGETLADRAWRVLGEACDERIAVGKGGDEGEVAVPGCFADGVEERAGDPRPRRRPARGDGRR